MSDKWLDRLSEYIDGELSPEEVGQLEPHLAGCPDCATALEGLRAVARVAGALENREPEADLWQNIARRIEVNRVVEIGTQGKSKVRRVVFSIPQLAAAAIALIVISGGVALRFSGKVDVPEVAREATQAGEAQVLHLAGNIEADFQVAIRDMEEVLRDGRTILDSATIAVLEESLQVIDSAIREARMALAVDPSSAYLNRYLTRTMRRKMDVLEHGNNLIAAASL